MPDSMLTVQVTDVALVELKLSRGVPLGELPGRMLFHTQISDRLKHYWKKRLPLREDRHAYS